MQPYLNTFDGFQVGCIQYGSRYFHGIDGCTRRESIGEMAHRIALVIVYNRIREVDRIGRRVLQGIQQFDNHLLSNHLDFGLFQLRRRHNNLLRRFLQLNELVKLQFQFLALGIHRTQLGGTSHKLGRCFIVRTSIRSSHAGTGISHNDQHQNQGQSM